MCALNKKILNLLNEESVSGESSGPLVILNFGLMRIIAWICEYYVTDSEKTAHFTQDFKIELLVL